MRLQRGDRVRIKATERELRNIHISPKYLRNGDIVDVTSSAYELCREAGDIIAVDIRTKYGDLFYVRASFCVPVNQCPFGGDV